jgi:UDP-3-O-[3-hydroxymyristoyl] glucosamine N-acyltransferase
VKLITPITIADLANELGASVVGDYNTIVTGINTLQNAAINEVSFLANPLYTKYLAITQAAAVIVSTNNIADCNANLSKIITDNPRLALAKLIRLCVSESQPLYGTHSTVIIGTNCKIASQVIINANCVLGNNVVIKAGVYLESGVVIGDNCMLDENVHLKANVTVYKNVKIGKNTCIHSGTVIGSDGFGYANDNGQWIKMLHVGGVTIGANVEIGSNTSIDRGFLEDTMIHDNVIIDNLVQIAHNVSIGQGTAIAGCVGIAGSTFIGENCLIGGGACIAGHISIANRVSITATSAVNNNITNPGVYSSGFPARENSIWRKNVARFQFLDSMAKKVRQLEKDILTIKGA